MHTTVHTSQTAYKNNWHTTAWLSLFLLAVVHLSLATSLEAAKWAEGLEVGARAVVLGVLVGALLSRTHWPRWFVRIYVLVTGIALTLYLTSTLVNTPFSGAQRPIEVLHRFVVWGEAVIQGTPSTDNLIFVADVTFLLWWLSLSTTEQLLRYQKVWTALLPTGIILTINAYYASQDLTLYVLIYLAASLLLLVTTHLNEQIYHWSEAHVRYSPDISWDFLRNGVMFSLMILLLAWMLPAVNPSSAVENWTKPIREPWRQVQQEWGRMFNALRYKPGAAIPTFGRTFNLRGAPNLSDTPYFLIRAQKGRYWRSAVYDTYRENRWDDTMSSSILLDAYQEIKLPAVENTVWLTQTVTPLLPGTLSLVAAPNPVRFSIPVNARLLRYPASLDGAEILFAYAQQVLPQGQTYSVISLVPNPSASALRSANTDYPEWVRAHYLQLPPTLPTRVAKLASDIAAPFDNPYDKAKAIERYLRSIPYNENIPAPPRDRDAVDWFLFELQQGYCDYYASAMVLMVRSLGIPARVASGYARGEYDEQAHTWVVRESDAHTWPEIWFPGYGWIPFEPTPSEPPLNRTEEARRVPDENGLLDELRNRPEREPNIPEDNEQFGTAPPVLGVSGPLSVAVDYVTGVYGWFIGVVFLTLYILWRIRRRLSERLLLHPMLPQVLYSRLVRWGRRLGAPLTASQTPEEQLHVLIRHLPRYKQMVEAIVKTYEHMLYAPPQARREWEQQRGTLIQIWNKLFPRLWKEWAIQRLRTVEGLFVRYMPISFHRPRSS